ncbi:glycosyltransferase [Clostridium ljungdahlii]|uniref:Putative glycosyltransferase EpsF n=1 Tax=Clostridium ljungdahlii TaxID=1538 RepID=A0A168NVN4_9CLOT|nr:glycosyltransferase [Clostridium ljungdahlii]OAA86969.1 putative glycosyltransferase EpsF [Clostridium ljungdahlii]
MVKVLIILGGLGGEGISNSVLTYLETMDKKDIDIYLGVAGPAKKSALKRAQAIGINLSILPGRNSKPILYFKALKEFVRTQHFDIVHVHGNSATLALDMLAAKRGGCNIRIAHSRNTSCTHPIIDKVLRPLFYANYTDGFACGEKAGKWLFKNRPFTVIPNGKNINRFLFNADIRNTMRRELGIDDKIVLGHVGVFNIQKNHAFLIEIFREICTRSNRYVLVLIGEDGGLQSDIKKKVNDYNLNDKVKFIGFKRDIEKYLCAMDIMVFPSIYEGLPNVVLEWQLSGLPSLLSDCITRECKVMDYAEYLPLDKGEKFWTDKILSTSIRKRNGEQNYIKSIFLKAGYDIENNAKLLKQIYFKLVETRLY